MAPKARRCKVAPRRRGTSSASTSPAPPTPSRKAGTPDSSPAITPRKMTEPEVVTMGKDTIKKIFSRFDLNGNGVLEENELATVFKILAPRKWTSSAIQRLIQGMDLDEDGVISCSEFTEWIFDTGTASFKGALEIAETIDGARTLQWAVADMERPYEPLDLHKELAVLEGADIREEVEGIDPFHLQKLQGLAVAPEPIRRLLECLYLLLLPSTGILSVSGLTPPEWPGIQQMLQDSSLLQRIQDFDARVEEFKTRPMWGAHVARAFFTIQKVDPDILRFEGAPAQPLRYEQVWSACQVQFDLAEGQQHAVLTLYRWILALLESDLRDIGASQAASLPS